MCSLRVESLSGFRKRFRAFLISDGDFPEEDGIFTRGADRDAGIDSISIGLRDLFRRTHNATHCFFSPGFRGSP